MKLLHEIVGLSWRTEHLSFSTKCLCFLGKNVQESERKAALIVHIDAMTTVSH